MSDAPLISNASKASIDSTGSVKRGLSMQSVISLKIKLKHWRQISHEHALDHAMAMKGGHKVFQRTQDAAKKGHEHHEEDDDHLQSNQDAVTNMLNNALGSGIVCMPHMVKKLGVPLGIGTIAFSAIANRYMLLLVLKCCKLAGIETSYNTCAKTLYGAPGRYAVIFVFICMGFGSLVSYVDAVTDSLGGLLKVVHVELPPKLVMLSSTILLFPPTFIRNLSSVATLSAVAFVGAIVIVICVMGKCGSQLITNFPPMDKIAMVPEEPYLATILAGVPTGICVMAIQAGGSIICSSLRDGSSENQAKVSGIAYAICFCVFTAVALPAYLVYLDDTKGDVLESFEPTAPSTIIAKFAILDLVVLSYMFMMIPCRVALIQLFFDKNEVKMEATYPQFLAVTIGVNLAAVGIASLVSDLALVVGLIGCVAANLVAFIIPSLLYIKVMSKPALKDVTPVPIASARNIPYFIIIVLAMFSMVAGLYVLFTN